MEILYIISNILIVIIEFFIVGVISNIYIKVKNNEKLVKTLEGKMERCQKECKDGKQREIVDI